VARNLLGKLLVRRSVEGETGGVIVETEAYPGEGDPASRGSREKTRKNEIVWERGGLAFIDMVHGRWLLNITTERPGKAGAVLVRAIEPTVGVEIEEKGNRQDHGACLGIQKADGGDGHNQGAPRNLPGRFVGPARRAGRGEKGEGGEVAQDRGR
jgi:3-methyladenine DNA glycosylase Mpg